MKLISPVQPLLQRQEEEEEEKPLMTKSTSGRTHPIRDDLHMRLNGSRGSGQAMPETDRSFMEKRFGSDFSGVRVHTDSNAAQMSRELNAEAFTYGRDIYFGAGRYSPGTSSGKRLMAHELTHVVQQGGRRGQIRGEQIRQTIRRKTSNCTSKKDSKGIIKSHTVKPNIIEKPGDSVKFTVEFNCNVRSWISHIETKSGNLLGLKKPKTKLTNKYERKWDGKKYYKKVGSFLVNDGDYRHRIEKLLYAYKYDPRTKKSDNLYATGPKLNSPVVKVKMRTYKGTGIHHAHYTL
ncbi:MAG: DUF4157 domain-containing protein [Candidatus Scalindua sp.]